MIPVFRTNCVRTKECFSVESSMCSFRSSLVRSCQNRRDYNDSTRATSVRLISTDRKYNMSKREVPARISAKLIAGFFVDSGGTSQSGWILPQHIIFPPY